ncbi:type IV conjugative transfer system pilin TraA [Rahnella sp. BIGb0236]|uniref:type IV conjugative transfer system pilin TraA n=1 Tax=Rahnella sp. BIGb0236 TaxID=2485117 RepID=UPI00105B2793|nr:type IV conjugative transfer system pilin TraA [Rahnella sp. BIGb0236]TDS84825.1 type IV conjugative transfer system pilin TraA [Rahnella sp. BIGb0236]
MELSIKAKGISVFKKVKSAFTEMNQALKAAGGVIPAIAALMFFSGNALADDLMAAGKGTVTDTFGANSAIATWIILAEVIVGIITYIKTKNMFMLFGIAVVIVFTTIGFGLAA